MAPYQHGRHEHGQNFLIDRSVVRALLELVAGTQGPIIEVGPGDGALTMPLQQLQRPLTVVEIDSRLAARLSTRAGSSVQVVNADFLRYRLPSTPHVLVGNLPFHLTTAVLRHVLHAPGWTDAVLLVQWEVARRRAGVGGATLMTAQWSPWFTFELHARVPAAAFRPQPSVDGGVLVLGRRTDPLLAVRHRTAFMGFAHRVFTGPGRGLADVLHRAGAFASTNDARRWLQAQRLPSDAVPKGLSTAHWVELFRATDTSPPRKRRQDRRCR